MHTDVCVSGSSKTQTLLPSNVIEISPQGFKFCNSVEKHQSLLGGNNVWILLEPLTCITFLPVGTHLYKLLRFRFNLKKLNDS